MSDSSSVGYILNGDVCHSTYLHDEHNNLPFLPDNNLMFWMV